jgi:predicted nucleic acid-binding protein
MYLVDTNVWIERLLEQARSEEVRHFLDRTERGGKRRRKFCRIDLLMSQGCTPQP